MKLQKLGMRTIKSGIATMFCILISKHIVENLFFCAIGCVVSVQDTVKGSLKTGLFRIYGTIVGGIIGYSLALIKPGDPILCGLGVIILIYTCNLLHISTAIMVSCITFFGVHLGVGSNDPAFYAINRTIDTSVGVLFGIAVNYLIVRPNYLKLTVNGFKKIEKISIQELKNKIINDGQFNIEKLEKEIQKIEIIKSKLIDENDYTKVKQNLLPIEKSMKLCREIYFHMRSIELFEKKLYLNNANYYKLLDIFELNKIMMEINEDESPVFNYHLGKIIDEIYVLHKINNTNEQ